MALSADRKLDPSGIAVTAHKTRTSAAHPRFPAITMEHAIITTDVHHSSAQQDLATSSGIQAWLGNLQKTQAEARAAAEQPARLDPGPHPVWHSVSFESHHLEHLLAAAPDLVPLARSLLLEAQPSAGAGASISVVQGGYPTWIRHVALHARREPADSDASPPGVKASETGRSKDARERL